MSLDSPMELDLFKITPNMLNVLKEVTTGQIFETPGRFHPDGLFSIEIFGRVGTEERKTLCAYINLKLKVIHPTVYKYLISLSSLYTKIMEGKAYAIFDKSSNDFIESSDPRAETGYNFFIKHLPKVKIRETESEERMNKINLVYKAIKEGKLFWEQLLVIPAAMRDYIVKPDGKPEEDEINMLYRKVIGRASLVDENRASRTPEVYDESSLGIQKAIAEIWDYIYDLIYGLKGSGKHKLIQGKFVSRKVFNSSSNVAASYINKSKGINDPKRLSYNDCRVGLHQFARSAMPLSTYMIRNKYIREIFDNTSIVLLTNAETWKREEVVTRGIQKDVDLWTTSDGIEKIVASLGNPDLRSLPILFKSKNNTKGKGHYLGLIYSDDKCFRFFQDIDELPEHLDKSKVRPITLYEFIYISIYSMDGKYPGLVTRYPVTGYGSIYPAMVRLATTVESLTLYEMDQQWEMITDDPDYRAINFPKGDSTYIGTMNVVNGHMGSLGLDFDGDMIHLKMLLSTEAIKEIKNFLNKRAYYISDKNELIFSSETNTLDAVLKTLT